MGTEPVINVDITIDNTGVPRQGFGTMLIASHNADWPERTRDYASPTEAAVDWPTDSPEYLAISAAYAQDDPPDLVKVGRVASPVTQRYSVEVASVVNSHAYSLGVSGEDFEEDDAEYTSDASATKQEIHNGLVAALNAITDKTFTATFSPLASSVDFTFTAAADDICTAVAHGLNTGDGPFQLTTTAADLPLNLLTATNYWAIRIDADTFYLAESLALALAGTRVDIADAGTGVHTVNLTAGTTLSPILPFLVTADAAGAWFSLDVPVADLAKINIAQTHAAGTLDEDLAAILLEDDEWYCLITLYNSNAYVKEAAAWVESNGRIYVVDIAESEAINTAFDIETPTATDTGGEIAALGYKRTLVAFHPRPSAFFAAGWMGLWLPTTPGKATAALKTVNGLETTKLTSTQRGRLEDRRMSAYLRIGGRGITWESKVPNTTHEYLDVTRNVDYLKDGLSAVGFGILAGAPIVPYTPTGIAQVSGGVLGFLTGEATDNGVLDRETAIKAIPPKFTSIPTIDKKERKLRQLKFRARLSGAIHAAFIEGTVSF